MRHLSPLARLQEFTASINRETRLGIFLGNMQFQQHLHHAVVLGSLLINLLQELQAIHRLNHGDIRSNILHLVSLQMTDEMPLDIFRQGSHLLGKFLLMALAKDALPLGVRRLNKLVGMKLADGYKANPCRQAAQHFMKISFYIIHSSSSLTLLILLLVLRHVVLLLLLVARSMVLENIHQLGLVQAYYIIVDHGLAHHLVDIAECTSQRLSLYEICNIRALLLFRLFIDGDELELSLVPLVIIINIAEEDLSIASLTDTADLQLAAYIDRHLVDNSALCLGETQGINHVCFRNHLF